MMPFKIFISYRRVDSQWPALRLRDQLCLHLPEENVFFDSSIPIGTDFHRYVANRLIESDVLIAVIGERWLPELQTRQAASMDYVRFEIRLALHAGLVVVPLLLDGAKMPSQEELPADIRNLALRNAALLRIDSFETDVETLIKRLQRSPTFSVAPKARILTDPARTGPNSRWGRIVRRILANILEKQIFPHNFGQLAGTNEIKRFLRNLEATSVRPTSRWMLEIERVLRDPSKDWQGLGALRKLDRPLRVAVPVIFVGAIALLYWSRIRYGVDLYFDFYPHAIRIASIAEMERWATFGMSYPDLIITGDAPSLWISEVKRPRFLPTGMMLPRCEQRIVRRRGANVSKYLILKPDCREQRISTQLVAFRNHTNRATSEEAADANEALLELIVGDRRVAAVLWSPHWELALAVERNLEALPTTSGVNADWFTTMLLASETCDNVQLSAVELALRRSWRDLAESKSNRETIIAQMANDDYFWICLSDICEFSRLEAIFRMHGRR